MKLGYFTANRMDKPFEEVLDRVAKLGYEAVEIPAFKGNPHLDVDRVLEDRSYAKQIKEAVQKEGL